MMSPPSPAPGTPARHASRVTANEPVSATSRLMSLDRCGLAFRAGHEILLHGRDHTEDRQYSIASGEADAPLQILYRVIPDGVMSPRLAAMQPGDAVEFTGPIGSFLIRDFLAPIVFIATGTGIAPAVSFARSFPELNLTILHGVRRTEDLFGRELFAGRPYFPCVSGQPESGFFPGRVTDFLPGFELPEEAQVYLCGANAMILAVRKQLKQRGLPDSRIFSEAYYFW